MTDKYKILLDIPLQPEAEAGQHLALGFEELANAFEQVIEHSDPQFAIGLFGGWGSGKTTLMRAIERKLDPATCATVWFSAWRYEKEEHLIVPLLDVIREGLVAWVDRNAQASAQLKTSALKVAGSIGKAIDILLRGFSVNAKISGLAEIGYDAGKALDRAERIDKAEADARAPRSFYHASFRAMQEAFSEFTENGARRIVVFVDDLDRCLPDGALEVLESMKLFFDLRGFVFVVGVDRRVVEMSVDKRYREMQPPPEEGLPRAEAVTGAQYLRKIFQVPYGLAPVSAAQIDDFLQSVHDNSALPTPQWQEIDADCRPHLRYLVDDTGVNPREIKRFLNSYTLLRKIRPGLNPHVVLALQTIAFRPDWAEVQLALLAFRDVFMDALKREVDEPGVGHLGTVWPTLESPPASFLTYVSLGAPGVALCDHAGSGLSIDDYIFSGEATRSSEGSNFVYVFRTLGEAVLHIKGALENNKDVKEILNHLSQALNQLSSSSESMGGQYEGARREIDALMRDIETSDWDTLEMRQGLADRWITRMRGVISALQELYRAGLT